MLTQRDDPGWRRWAGILLLSALVQLPLFGSFLLQTDTDGPPEPRAKKRTVLQGRFVERKKPPVKEEVLEELPDDAQIVEVSQPEEEEPPPVETKFVADRTTRTKKQTRSRQVAKPDKTKKAGVASPTKPSAIQSKDSQSPDETVTPKDNTQLALLQPKQKLPEADRGRQKNQSVLQQGAQSRLLLPSTSAKAQVANLQALSGTFASDDHLPDLERDASTLLNANKYKYADFFYRVKDAVRRHWDPNTVYRRRDPTGKVYGVKDRHTVLRVTLDDRGRLKQLVTKQHSGLDFMDAEARGAFRRAQPFPNPPKGLVVDGEIEFEFGFYFEISSGRHKFRWRRL